MYGEERHNCCHGNDDLLKEWRNGDDDHFVVSHHAVHVLDHVSQIVAVRSENKTPFIFI